MTTTAFITHRDCWLHDMGTMHPECPDRLSAINDRLIASGAPSEVVVAVKAAHDAGEGVLVFDDADLEARLGYRYPASAA